MNPLTCPPTNVGILRNFFVPPDLKYSRSSFEMSGSRSTFSQATGAPEKNSSRSPGSSFHDEGLLTNGCSGSAFAKFVPSAHARKTSESFDSSSSQRITLCADRRRPIVLSICPRNLSALAQWPEHQGCRSVLPPGRGRLARNHAEPPRHDHVQSQPVPGVPLTRSTRGLARWEFAVRDSTCRRFPGLFLSKKVLDSTRRLAARVLVLLRDAPARSTARHSRCQRL